MGRRARDEGGSQRRSAVDRIEGESSHGRHPPRRESGPTSLRCSVTREPWPTDSGRQADMSAAEMLAGAAPERTPDWHSIEWRKVWRTVRRLQARIVKAVAEGRWNKVKALVYLLTHSFSGRALAILRVISNSGAKTPGVDGVLWNTPEASDSRKNLNTYKTKTHVYTISQRNHYLGTLQTSGHESRNCYHFKVLRQIKDKC